eukprot:CFRG3127T1
MCIDINECLTGDALCDVKAKCTNTPGAYTCQCLNNYEGDGKTCECSANTYQSGDSCAPCSIKHGSQCSVCNENDCTSCDEGYILKAGLCQKLVSTELRRARKKSIKRSLSASAEQDAAVDTAAVEAQAEIEARAARRVDSAASSQSQAVMAGAISSVFVITVF